MDRSVDENLRGLSYSVAQGRVLGKLIDMGIEIIDEPATDESMRVSGGK